VSTLEDGFYAIADPGDRDVMTYWRARQGDLKPWPRKARYGPITRYRKADLPADPGQRPAFLRKVAAEQAEFWDQVADAIQADPDRARARFAEFAVRCWRCGRKLTDPESKVLGVGPDCRAWLPKESLARVGPGHVGRAHAAAGGGK
jgi:hypothetical protein